MEQILANSLDIHVINKGIDNIFIILHLSPLIQYSLGK